ncbi:MAG: hypothetical protein HY232_04830 [Acidobacteria bacterium]|nr:hypothetical protein [Acidobacteriota bacterium]
MEAASCRLGQGAFLIVEAASCRLGQGAFLIVEAASCRLGQGAFHIIELKFENRAIATAFLFEYNHDQMSESSWGLLAKNL